MPRKDGKGQKPSQQILVAQIKQAQLSLNKELREHMEIIAQQIDQLVNCKKSYDGFSEVFGI
eukprot:2828446-Ditylum_brightwellii.AAC.1